MKYFPILGSLLLSVAITATPHASQAISGGVIDDDTPLANAVGRTVFEYPEDHPLFESNTTGCTVTLITPQIVIGAGHCIGRADVAEPFPWKCDGTISRSDQTVPLQWHPFNRGEEKRWIQFGRDFSDFLNETPETSDNVVSYSEYAQPSCFDIILLRLDEPVSPDIAVPVKVLTSLGGQNGTEAAPDFLSGKVLIGSGWGGFSEELIPPQSAGDLRAPDERQRGQFRFTSTNNTQFFVQGIGNAAVQQGDSGSALFWDSPTGRRYIVGINQGFPGSGINTSGVGSYTATFTGPVDGRPSVGWFLERLAPDAVSCDTSADWPEGTLPLRSWYSPERQDNFATSQQSWIGCDASIRSPDYRYSGIEGYIFNPTLPQPVGTVPLYSWFAPSRDDNLLGGGNTWSFWDGGGRQRSPDYRVSRLEGYVYDPARPQPAGTVPLYRWYSPGRGDNWTTSRHGALGAARQPLSPDYRYSRLVGYVIAER